MFVILGLKTNKEAQLRELRKQLKAAPAVVTEALSCLASVFTFTFFFWRIV